MTTLANLYLVGFALDAALSILDELARAASGLDTLALPRGVVAEAVLLASPLVYALLIVDARLPVRVLLPLVVFAVWAGLGAPPLLLLIDRPHAAEFLLDGVQGLLAAGALVAVRRSQGGRRWLLRDDPSRGPRFRPGRTLAFAGVSALVLPVALGLCALVSLAGVVEQSTGGFVRFGWTGVDVVSERWARGERSVDLVGMVHVGESGAYGEIFEDFAREPTIVLAEGVTDREDLIPTRLSYEALSEGLGLSVQPGLGEYFAQKSEAPEIRPADLDTSDFSPTTIRLLAEAADVYASDSLVEAWRRARSFAAAEDAPALLETARADLIDKRNEHLAAELDAALEEGARVVVPWGAFHLPAIRAHLQQRGFTLEQSHRRSLARYETLLGALLARAHGAPAPR
jgi:TraB/PrgY/gumN family